MQKVFDFSLKAFLLLSPVFTFRDYLPSFARSLFFICGSLVIFGVSLMCKQKRELSNKWVSAFFLLSLLPVFFNNDNFFYFWGSMYGFFYVLCGIILFRTVVCYSENISQYLKPIVIICLANIVLSSCQLFGYDFFWNKTSAFNPICGFFESPSQLGQYSAMSVPVLFFLNPFLAIVPIISLFLSKSITPIVSLFFGTLFFGWQLKKKLLVVLALIVFITIGIFNFSYVKRKWYTRPIMWEKTLMAAIEKPFVGWGYGSFDSVVVKTEARTGKIINPGAFNDYFHTAQELGFSVLVAVGMFFIGLFKKIKRKDLLSICLATSIIIVLVNMSGQALIRHASVSGTVIVLLALLYVKINDEVMI